MLNAYPGGAFRQISTRNHAFDLHDFPEDCGGNDDLAIESRKNGE
jgi:hypothetical protein